MSTRNPGDWIALNLLLPLGPLRTRRLLDDVGDPGEIAYRIPLARLGIRGRGLAEVERLRPKLDRLVERELRKAERLGARILTVDSPEYPAMLTTLPDAPVLLYLRGELPQDAVRVGVVGSRHATAYGRRGRACR